MLTVLTQCIETEEFSDIRFKQCAGIEFLTVEKVPPIEIHSCLWWSVCWCEYSKALGYVVEEVKSAVRKWFQNKNTNFFKDGFQKLVQRWWKCIEVRGDFVEK